MTTLLTTKDNYNRYDNKYIKIGDDKLWKVYIKR